MKTGEKGQIAERAYHIWEQQGRPHGRDLEHWLQAEQETAVAGKPARSGATTSAQAGKAAASRGKRATAASPRKTTATRKPGSKKI